MTARLQLQAGAWPSCMRGYLHMCLRARGGRQRRGSAQCCLVDNPWFAKQRKFDGLCRIT